MMKDNTYAQSISALGIILVVKGVLQLADANK